jgi:hypothetical protein
MLDALDLYRQRRALARLDDHALNDIGLTRAEAGELCDAFDLHFSGEGLRLLAPRPDRWYLLAETPPQIRTRPLHEAVGRSINALLPRGPGGVAWARLLNETQMLFHHSNVNKQREREGRLAVSGIWPWGGGRLSGVSPRSDYVMAFGEPPLIAGLSAAAGVALAPLPEDAGGLLRHCPEGNVLVYWHALWSAVLGADGVGWEKELRRLDGWLSPLPGVLKRAEVRSIELVPCDGRLYRVTARGLRRFWRPFFRISDRLGSNAEAR